jgi:hypothetical protein
MYAWNLEQAYKLFSKEVMRVSTALGKGHEY